MNEWLFSNHHNANENHNEIPSHPQIRMHISKTWLGEKGALV